MLQFRVIPCLLLKNRGFVKTKKFKDPIYLGDPRNIVKIFNEKEVDELVVLDITASVEKHKPQFELIEEIVSEAFIPVTYGGGIDDIEDAKRILAMGVEKIVVCTNAVRNPEFIRQAAELFGGQSVIVSIDVKKNFLGGYKVASESGQKLSRWNPVDFAIEMEKLGAGEIIINSIDRDSIMGGYDLELVKSVSEVVNIPVIASGGAGKLEHFREVVETGHASAVAAGSIFVFQGNLRGILINYPTQEQLKETFKGLTAG